MGGWTIKCTDSHCGHRSRARDIVDLIEKYRDSHGWFECLGCGKQGYIEKVFDLQELGEVWKPFLRGAIPLGGSGTYQPFVFLVSDKPCGETTGIWFSYYKDLRAAGGRLKLGYGPGGPPVLGKPALLALLAHLVTIRCLTRQEIVDAVSELENNPD